MRGIVASVIAVVMTATVSTQQRRAGSAFGPGHCGPVDASYVRVTNATGGQILPLGPSEMSSAAPLLTASSGTETVFWATGSLSANGQTIRVPVDGVTSRVAFIASSTGDLSDMVVSDPRGTAVGAGSPGVEASAFACVRAISVARPASGEWSIRVMGSGTFWLVVHARSDLALDEAEFVRVAGRPGHEGLFRIPGQPVAGRAATLRARITREEVTDAAFDLVSMSGASLQSISLAPVTPGGSEDEYVGAVAQLPATPFRVRVSGRDRTGAVYQRVSPGAFHAAAVEVITPDTVSLTRGARTPITVRIRNVGPAARFQIVAVAAATVMRVEPPAVQLATNDAREVTIWADVPSAATTMPDIIVTVESAGSANASNSAILKATLDEAR